MKNEKMADVLEFPTDDNSISIYIHIPFCERKCSYCAFVSFCLSKIDREKYIQALLEEIESFSTVKRVKTIYLGGGTPSLLTKEEIFSIFRKLREKFDIDENAEITIEVNPNSVEEEKLKAYKEVGVNRISVGVQSLSNKSLKSIGRLHTKKEAIEKLKLIGKYFENISADLILGLSGEKSVVKYAKKLIKLNIKHISSYMLEVHENTKLYFEVRDKKYRPLDEIGVTKSYDKLVKFLKKHGFVQYEVSNFALAGYESKHNLNYWSYGEYVGFGVSSHSFLNGKRIANSGMLQGYYKHERKEEKITKSMEIEERIMLGLRCYLGVDIAVLKSLGYDIKKNECYQKFLNADVIYEDNDKFYLRPEYYKFSDYYILNLLP